MMRPLNRIQPKQRPEAYDTYTIAAPKDTHFRAAECEETGCPDFLIGWTTIVNEALELGQAQAYWIRGGCGRPFRETRGGDGLTSFHFPPGLRCFRPHSVRIMDRPEIYTVRGGDYRRFTSAPQPMRPQDWVERFGENQERLATMQKRG